MADLLTTLDAVMLEYAAAISSPLGIAVTVTPAESTVDGLAWTFTGTVTACCQLRVVTAGRRGAGWADAEAELEQVSAVLRRWQDKLEEAALTTAKFLGRDDG